MKTLFSIFKTVNVSHSVQHIEIEGSDPVLTTPFILGEAGAASLAAVGYAAAKLWQLKTNRLQSVKIQVRDAAIAQRSHLYIKQLNSPPLKLWDAFSGFYATKDQRWIQFHCNFLHHQQGVLNFFKCGPDKDKLIAAVKQYPAEQIEESLNSQGLCSAILRSNQEWLKHPQGQAVSQLPLLEIIKMGDSHPEPLPEGEAPLSGIRILDLSRVLAGPVCGKILAQLGADVLRIAHPELPFILPLVMDTGFGKRNAYLNLENVSQHQQLLTLVKQGDVFLQAYRPGALADKGFSPQALAKHRPGIICIDLSAYSHVGPWSNRHGYDSLVQTAMGIAVEQTGDAIKPQHLPAQSLDYLTGYLAAFAIQEALYRRAIEGGSYWIRLSLAQTGNWLLQQERKTEFESCKNPEADDISELLAVMETPFGALQHLKPVLHMAETPLIDRSPPYPLGSHAAEWLTR